MKWMTSKLRAVPRMILCVSALVILVPHARAQALVFASVGNNLTDLKEFPVYHSMANIAMATGSATAQKKITVPAGTRILIRTTQQNLRCHSIDIAPVILKQNHFH